MALSADLKNHEMASSFGQEHAILAKDSTQFYKGGLVAVDLDDGKLAKAAAGDLTLVVVGRCSENVLTGTSNTRKVKFRSGIFNYASGATFEAITAAHVGQPCYVVTDESVGISGATGANSLAGRVYDYDANGVWVGIHFPLPQLAPVGPTGA